MSAAKRARVMLSTDRLKAVEHAMRFDEVMDLVKFHYAGSLRAVYAEVKDARDAAIERLLRAYAMVEVLDKQDRRWRRYTGSGNDRIPVERSTEIALYYEIRAFAPEFVNTVSPDEHPSWAWYGWDGLFDRLRGENADYIGFKERESISLQRYHARARLKDCKTAGTKAQIRAARIVAIQRIRERADELSPSNFFSQFQGASPEYTKRVVYDHCCLDMWTRLYHQPSVLESIQGESPSVRHLEAYRRVEFVQRLYNKWSVASNPRPLYREDLPSGEEGEELTELAWRAVTTIKSFAPELVAVGEGVHPRPLDPWPIIQRLIEATAWAK
jgi:hypothetical protein